MNATLTTPAWKSYRIGTRVTLADGRVFEIVEVSSFRTEGGYKSRRFALVGPNGEHVRKSSRGITLWVAGLETDSGERVEPAPAPVAPAPQPVAADDDVLHHANYHALLSVVRLRLCSWVFGDASSGKSVAAAQVAKTLGLKYYEKSVSIQTTESSLLGYYDATGRCVRTQLREAYEHGGVFLLDEADCANPAILAVINNLLASDNGSFPDAVVPKHKDFIVVAAANSTGRGGDREYVKGQQIDASTLDRFVFLRWDLDPAIEAFAAGVPLHAVRHAKRAFSNTILPSGGEERAVELVERVVAIRNAIAAFGGAVRGVKASTRASKHGAALCRAGWTVEEALDAVVWKGCDSALKTKIESAA